MTKKESTKPKTPQEEQPKDLSSNPTLRSKVEFRAYHVIIFALVFAMVGGYAIWKSFAAGPGTPYGLTSTIADGSTISGTVDWSVSLSPQPQSVEFYIDGVKDTTVDSSPPYSYKGTSNSLDTTKLTNGNHTFQEIALYASASTITTHKVIINNQAPPPPPPSAAPTISLNANPSSINPGSTSIVTWTSTGATSCSASGAWSGTKSTSGSQTLAPSATSTYTLTCIGAGGSTSSSVSIMVNASTPPPTPTPTPTPPPSADTTKPSTPSSFKVVGAGKTSISMSWTASTDNVGVSGYNIYANNSFIGSVSSPSVSATHSNLSTRSTYSYYVAAFDKAGNVSAPSQKVCVGSWNFWSNWTGQRSWRNC